MARAWFRDAMRLTAITGLLVASAACAQPAAVATAPVAEDASTTLASIAAPVPPRHPDAAGPPGTEASFAQWLADRRADAIAEGLDPVRIDAALATVEFVPRAIELDGQQPEFTRTFWQYHDNAISELRVAEGRFNLARLDQRLDALSLTYGIPPEILVALWGLETNYGSFMGSFEVLSVLATLGYEGRRTAFFEGEFMNALRIVGRGQATAQQMIGSWAGAMGQTQFMPSTFLAHATDGNGDGRIDLWNSTDDALTSGAAYLSAIGWRAGAPWADPVTVPDTFPWADAELSVSRSVAEWQALGVSHALAQDLPPAATSASLLLPMGHAGPGFLVYDNFRVIMDWNRSTSYALAVSILADRIAGRPVIDGPRPTLGEPLRTVEVVEMQELLNVLGHDAGEADGRVGPMTRAALRSYQGQIGRPADGYPTLALLQRLRSDARL